MQCDRYGAPVFEVTDEMVGKRVVVGHPRWLTKFVAPSRNEHNREPDDMHGDEVGATLAQKAAPGVGNRRGQKQQPQRRGGRVAPERNRTMQPPAKTNSRTKSAP
jgi:hypothetical protein